MRKLINVTLLALLILAIISCGEDDQVSSREFPKLNTLEVSNITANGATFNAEFSFRGDFEITSYGFVWSRFSKDFTLDNSDKVIIHKNINEPAFSLDVLSALEEDKTYYVRSFVKTDEFIVYGQAKEFISLGSNAPQIDNVSPLSIFYGDTVSIFGANFSFAKDNNQVKFGGVSAEVASATDTLLHVLVPELIQSENSTLSVSVAGNVSESTETLNFIGPEITSLSKTEVVYGDTVEIFGNHFGYHEGLNSVKIAEEEIVVLETDSTKIKVVLPVTNKNFTISITNSVGQTSASELTTLDPILTQITPDEGFYGDEIEIKGNHFGYIEEIVEVYFNDQKAEIVSFSNESIETRLPEGLKNPITAKVLVSGTETNLAEYYYLGPQIDSFSPKNGTWGDQVTIVGNNFSTTPSENTVIVDGINAEVFSSTQNAIVISIPNEVNNKDFLIKVEVNDVQVEAKEEFTMNDPVISSITPSYTKVSNQKIVVEGSNFNPVLNANSLTFNEINLDITSSTQSKIEAILHETVIENLLVTELIKAPIILNNVVGEISSDLLTIDYKTAWESLSLFDLSKTIASYQIGSIGYIILSDRKFYQYDSKKDNWTRLSSFPGSVSPGTTRGGGVYFELNNKLYYGLGSTTYPCESNPNAFCRKQWSDFWVYDPISGVWNQLNSLPIEGSNASISVLDNEAYLTRIVTSDGHRLITLKYNSTQDTWSELSPPIANNSGIYTFTLSSFTCDNNLYGGLSNL